MVGWLFDQHNISSLPSFLGPISLQRFPSGESIVVSTYNNVNNSSSSGSSSDGTYFEGAIGTVAIVFWIVYTPAFLVILIMFLLRRERSPIKQREPYLLATSAVGGYLMMTSYCFETFAGPQNYPCILSLWLIWFAFPLYFLPNRLRCSPPSSYDIANTF